MCTCKSTRVRHVVFRWAHAHGALHAVAMATADSRVIMYGEGLKGQGPRRSTIISVHDFFSRGPSSLQSVTLRRDTFRGLAVVAHCTH